MSMQSHKLDCKQAITLLHCDSTRLSSSVLSRSLKVLMMLFYR